jgi:hypothetical protein
MADWYYGDIIKMVEDMAILRKDIEEIKEHVKCNTEFAIKLFKEIKIPEEARLYMDKEYKSLIKKEKSLEKDTKKVLSKDAKRDKLVEKGKKKMKKGC